MNTHRVLTAVGPDRPGIVSEISAAIRSAGANLEDGRMAILGGEFALIVLYSGAEPALDAAEAATRAVAERLELQLSFRATDAPRRGRDFISCSLSATGLDRPGIVEAVARVLAAREVNVASLETRLVHAPLSGTPTFQLEAEVQVPSGTSLGELRRALQDMAERENLDVSLEAGA